MCFASFGLLETVSAAGHFDYNISASRSKPILGHLRDGLKDCHLAKVNDKVVVVRASVHLSIICGSFRASRIGENDIEATLACSTIEWIAVDRADGPVGKMVAC